MDLKKSFIVLAILPILVVLAISAVSAINTINVTFTSINNGTIYSNTNATTHTINFTIVNTTSFNGYNLSLMIDSNHSVLCYGNGTGGYAHANIGANCSSALVSGTTFTINVNLTEGVHVVKLNVSQFGTGNADNATTGDLGAGSNDSFIITNFDSLAFVSGVPVNFANLSKTALSVNITYNTAMFRNITANLYNFTVGPVIYNRTMGVGDFTSVAFTGMNITWSALPNNWYTVNISILGNVTALGTNKTITRFFVLDTVVPTASSITCTGWKSVTSATVEKAATFTCSCSGTDNNATSGLTYTYDPSSTPTTATLGDKSVTCNTLDPAGNAKSSSALAYRVVEVVTDGGSSGGGGGGGGSGAGAGGAGNNASSDNGGDAGAHTTSSISGASKRYAEGGGGGVGSGTGGTASSGGSGGSNAVGGTPTIASGEWYGSAGGGGGDNAGSTNDGGDGVQGIVIISYPTGSAVCTGGAITTSGGNTIHTFTSSGSFEVVSIKPVDLYYVSSVDESGNIKLSSQYDPYSDFVVTHGTTGTVTFDVYAVPNKAIAKATEKYNTANSTEYRYYILDDNGLVWVYDTQVYDSTLATYDVGVTWQLPDPVSTDITGIGILNGWLIGISPQIIQCKPTETLGITYLSMHEGYTMNPFDLNPKHAINTSQGTLIYTDGNFIGEIFPTTSLVTSVANVQSYAAYTAVTTTGTITKIIGGSLPVTTDGTRMPVVFFTSEGGTLPTSISSDTVYYLDYNNESDTFQVYTAITGGSNKDMQTGATGTQYFNTFYPVGSDAGSNGTNPLVQFSNQRVNLPFYESSKVLLEIGNTILIGCRGSKVYPWNQQDAVPSDVIALPESDVVAMINANNTAYIFAGNKGNIYITNNVVASLALKVPDYCAGVPGSPNTYIEPYFTWGDAMYVRGRVYFSILDQTATKAGNCGGVWSFIPSQNIDPSQEVGLALRLENQNSYGDYDGYANILIPNEEQQAIAPQYWAAWQDSYNDATAGFGIDQTASTPVTQAVIETDLIPTGTILDKTTFSQIEYKLATPLATNDSVEIFWRTNATSSWTSAGTAEQESDNLMSGYYRVNFQKTQWVQFRAIITTGGTAASSFVPVTEIRLR